MVQNVFRLEMHQNDFLFYFLKIIFEISTSKWSENIKKNLIFSKNKILNFLETLIGQRFQTVIRIVF
jgi:hypothetical protein